MATSHAQDLTRSVAGSIKSPPASATAAAPSASSSGSVGAASNGAAGSATDIVRTNTLQGPKPPKEYDETIIHKTILVGDSGVGKTSLIVQFDQGIFHSGAFSATVGVGFTNKIVMVDGNKVKLQIWDTAGQERFRSITRAYYRDAQALLLLYDVTSRTSFDNTKAWLAEINEYTQDDVSTMLIGNKCDMISTRVVRREDGEKLAKDYNAAFMETSAKTGMNVELAFLTIAKDLMMRKIHGSRSKGFNLSEDPVSQTNSYLYCCN